MLVLAFHPFDGATTSATYCEVVKHRFHPFEPSSILFIVPSLTMTIRDWQNVLHTIIRSIAQDILSIPGFEAVDEGVSSVLDIQC